MAVISSVTPIANCQSGRTPTSHSHRGPLTIQKDCGAQRQQKAPPDSSSRALVLVQADYHHECLGDTAMQYQTLRSVSDHHVFALCRDGTFYESVPEDVRKQRSI